MTRIHKHLFIQLSILARAFSYEININGELSFDMRITDRHVERTINIDEVNKSEEDETRDLVEDAIQTEEETASDDEHDIVDGEKLRGGVMVAADEECLYQYPDTEQFNAMLSNMMNELTKVFVRVNKLMRREDGRRRQVSRFRVVDKKDSTFFEDIYSNMTKEYSQFFNSTTIRVSRADDDPCKNQKELKEVWRELLERSLSSLRRATSQCIEEYLKHRNRSEDKRVRYKLEQFLLRELARIRTSQLDMLCDSFQLCFNDLL